MRSPSASHATRRTSRTARPRLRLSPAGSKKTPRSVQPRSQLAPSSRPESRPTVAPVLASVLGTIVTVYGLVAGGSSLLQARRMVRRGTSEDVSLSFLGMYVAGYALWLVYGLTTGSLPLIIVDVAGVLAGTCTLALAVSLRLAPRAMSAPQPGRARAHPGAARPRRHMRTRLAGVVDDGGLDALASHEPSGRGESLRRATPPSARRRRRPRRRPGRRAAAARRARARSRSRRRASPGRRAPLRALARRGATRGAISAAGRTSRTPHPRNEARSRSSTGFRMGAPGFEPGSKGL
jgi:uncharacterized protein with PQ loop repeat